MPPQLLALLTLLKALFFYGLYSEEVKTAFTDWIATLGGQDPQAALESVSVDDLEKVAAHVRSAGPGDPGKIFPGDGSFLKALLALAQQFLPYILPLITK